MLRYTDITDNHNVGDIRGFTKIAWFFNQASLAWFRQ